MVIDAVYRGIVNCFLQTTLDEWLTLQQGGVADLDVLPATPEDGGTGLELSANLAAAPGSGYLLGLVCLECGKQSLELRDSSTLAVSAFLQFGRGLNNDFQFGLGLASLCLHASERVRRRRELRIVRLEPLAEVTLVLPGSLELGTGAAHYLFALDDIPARCNRA